MTTMAWRSVVTGHAADGTETFLGDEAIRVTREAPGFRAGRLLSVGSFPVSPAGGGPETGAPPLAPGGLTVDAVIMDPLADAGPAETDRFHASATLDLWTVVGGEVVVSFDAGDVALGPGEVLVQRGSRHRIRTVGDHPARLVVARLSPDPAARPEAELTIRGAGGHAPRVRRVVSGADGEGRSRVDADGVPPAGFALGDVAMADLWQTGGRLGAVTQGGDAASFALEPLAGGVKVLGVDLGVGGGGGEAGWHKTATIDVDVIISGVIEMYLPGCEPVTLRAGDVLVQRATNHRWRAIEPTRMMTVMVAALA